MMSVLLVLNNFMKNLSTTKSNDLISDFFRGQASRTYIRIRIHLLKILQRAGRTHLTVKTMQINLNRLRSDQGVAQICVSVASPGV